MPVIQIDKNGFIKGTKQKFAMKVKTLKPMMIKGSYVGEGTVLDLEGGFLAEMLAYGKVEQVIEPKKELTDEESKAIIENMEVDPSPKKKAKKK